MKRAVKESDKRFVNLDDDGQDDFSERFELLKWLLCKEARLRLRLFNELLDLDIEDCLERITQVRDFGDAAEEEVLRREI